MRLSSRPKQPTTNCSEYRLCFYMIHENYLKLQQQSILQSEFVDFPLAIRQRAPIGRFDIGERARELEREREREI